VKVFQIGAAGGVGRRLSALLVARGVDVSGMHRAGAQAATIAGQGATPVAGDLIADSVDELAAKLAGHDAVVFSAGAHGTGADQTSAIDGEGVVKAAAAAAQAGVSRFLLVSVFPEAGRGSELGEGFEHYVRVKKDADAHLATTDLDWLIVRPGTLVDSPGTGTVAARAALAYGDVPRDDVAAFLDAALAEPRLNRSVVELTAGPTPVADAVAALIPRAARR
jgi:uncharacterized protein YbjT (DUF2867 family)